MEFTKSKSDDTVTVANKLGFKLGRIEKTLDGVPFFRAESIIAAFRIDELFEIAFAMAAMSPKDVIIGE